MENDRGSKRLATPGCCADGLLKHAPTFELAYMRENDTSDYAALAALACPRFSEAAVDLEHLTRWKFTMVKNPGRDGTSSPLAQPVVLQTEKTQRVSIG
jgi:hypothetical protein